MLLALLRPGGISVCRLYLQNKAATSKPQSHGAHAWHREEQGKGTAGLSNPRAGTWTHQSQAQHCAGTGFVSQHQGITEHHLQHLFALQQVWPFPEAPKKAVPAALGWDVQGGCHPCRVPDLWPGALYSSNDGKWSTKGLHAATQTLPLSRTGFAGLTDPKPQGLGQNTSLWQSTAKAMTRFAKNSLIINFNRVTCSTYLCFNYYASPLLLCWVEPILFSIRTLDEDELKPVIPNLAQNKIFSVLVHILMC